MALPQLVVALSFLALSSGNKGTKRDTTSQHLFMNTASQNATDQQREANGETYARFLRWARHSPTEEFSSVPFSPEAIQENQQSPWGLQRSAAMLLKAGPPPLDKIDGGYVTRELEEPEGPESLRGEALMTRRLALQPEFMPSHSALNQFRRKRSDLKGIPGPSDDVRLVKRLDMIDKGEWVLSGSSQRGKKGFGTSKKISGSGYDLWEKKNFDDSEEYVNRVLKKRNFDEIDRTGFHSLGRRNFDEIGRTGFHSMDHRNFDEIDRAGFHSLGRRNFDEIDKAGFHSLGRRNFDEIDRSGFYSLGRRNFDEIDRSGFHSLGRRNFDEIDKSAFRGFGKRDFDEIDRSGFRTFGKRNFDEIDRSGFRNFGKRNFDEIDRSGFRELGKRNSEHSLSFDESSKDSGEAYKVENNGSEKRNFDEANKSAFRNLNKRSTTKENSKISP